MSDHYDGFTPTPLDVLVACETLLRAGYTNEALSVMVSTFKNKNELRNALMVGLREMERNEKEGKQTPVESTYPPRARHTGFGDG